MTDEIKQEAVVESVAEVKEDVKVSEAIEAPAKVEEVKEIKEEVKAETKTEEPYWKEDWRETAIKEAGLTGEEAEAALKRLSRYSSPSAMAKSLVELNKKIASGEYKVPAPENEEALARWRKDNGIPEKPEDYKLELDNGFVLGEEDLPMVKGFLDVAHNKNLDNGTVKEVLSWYKGQEKALAEAETQILTEARNNTITELKAEWGAEFKENMNAVNSFMSKYFGDDVAKHVEFSIGPDGIPLGSNPNFVRTISQLSRDLDIGDYVVPGAVNKMESIADEMKTIEKKMGTTGYTNTDRNRYTELAIAKEKIESRR